MPEQRLVGSVDPRMHATFAELGNAGGNVLLYALTEIEAKEPGAQATIVEQLKRGARMRLVMDTNPHIISVQVLLPDGDTAQIFSIDLGEIGSKN